MKFFNYLFAFSLVTIKNSVSVRWGVLWFFQLVFIAIGFGNLVKPENVSSFNSILVIWSTVIVICLNIESSFSDLKNGLIKKLMVFGAAKSCEEDQSSSPQQ
jgi:hypothetical protein